MDDTNTTNTDAVNELVNLTSLVKSYITKVDNTRREIKLMRQAVNDSFDNDAVFQDQEQKAKIAIQVRNATKQTIMKSGAVAELVGKLKDMRFDLKDMEATLNDYLAQYQQLTGAKEIEDDNGELRDIVLSFKLIKRSFSKQ